MITQLESLEQRDPTLTPLLAKIVTDFIFRSTVPALAPETDHCQLPEATRRALIDWVDDRYDPECDYLDEFGGEQ